MATISKIRKVENYLRSQIATGKWAGGSRIPSEKYISSKLDVGYTTVKSAMSRLASDGVLERRQRLGTYVFDRKNVASIAILAKANLLTSGNSYFESFLIERIMRYVEDAGYRPVLKIGYGHTHEEFISSVHLLDNNVSKEIIGVVSLFRLGPICEMLQKAGIPAVSVAGYVADDPFSVVLDYDKMASEGAKLLKAKGHDKFVIIDTEVPGEDCNTPFAQKLRQLRFKTIDDEPERLLCCPYDTSCKYAYDAFKNYWLRGNRPGAVFFFDDIVFDVASRAILELGIKVPDELAFITMGNVGIHYHFPIAVTAIEFDLNEAIIRAWELLQKLIHNKKVIEPVIYLPPCVRWGGTL